MLNFADIIARAISDSDLIERYPNVADRVNHIIRWDVLPSGSSISTLGRWMTTLPNEIVTDVLKRSEALDIRLNYANLVVLVHRAIHDAVMAQIKIRK